MPWNEADENQKYVPEELNKKLIDISDVRSEDFAKTEQNELSIINYLVINNIKNANLTHNFKSDEMKKLYELWLETNFSEVVSGEFESVNLSSVYFKRKAKIENSVLFNQIIDKYNLNHVYSEESTTIRSNERKFLKRIFKYIFNIYNKDYLNDNNLDILKNYI